MFDYSKLKGRIKEICGTQDEFANRVGIGRVSLSKRLNNQLEFSQAEMLATAKVLNFNENEITEYFFNEIV